MRIILVILIFFIYLCHMNNTVFDLIENQSDRVFYQLAYRQCKKAGYKYFKAFRALTLALVRCQDGAWSHLSQYASSFKYCWTNSYRLAYPDKTIPDMVLSIYEANLQKIQERNENVIF